MALQHHDEAGVVSAHHISPGITALARKRYVDAMRMFELRVEDAEQRASEADVVQAYREVYRDLAGDLRAFDPVLADVVAMHASRARDMTYAPHDEVVQYRLFNKDVRLRLSEKVSPGTGG